MYLSTPLKLVLEFIAFMAIFIVYEAWIPVEDKFLLGKIDSFLRMKESFFATTSKTSETVIEERHSTFLQRGLKNG